MPRTQTKKEQIANHNLTGASLINDLMLFDETADYQVNDKCFWANSIYRCIQSITNNTTSEGDLTNAPNLNVDYWLQAPICSNKTGFINHTDSNLFINASTRTFTISPVVQSWKMLSNGYELIKSMPEDVVWSDIEGLHYFYYTSNGTLTHTDTFSIDFIIGDLIYVAVLYWDSINKQVILDSLFDERHLLMDPYVHLYLHNAHGMTINDGLNLTDLITDASGNVDSHAQFGVASGNIADEDIYQNISSINSTTGLPVLYLNGVNSDLRNGNPISGFSILNTGTGRAAYNEWTGSTWQLTEVPNNNFVLYHDIVSVLYNGAKRVFTLVGQNTYSSRNEARAGAKNEVLSIVTEKLPFHEFHIISTRIYQTSDEYNNQVKSRHRNVDADGNKYVDWRSTCAGSGNVTSIAPTIQVHNRLEIELLFKDAYNGNTYTELVRTNNKISQIDIWQNPTKTTKLFTRVITRTLDLITQITTTDEISNTTLVKNITRSNGSIINITDVYT